MSETKEDETHLTFEEWKAELANALDREWNWQVGKGLLYVRDEWPEAKLRQAYDEDMSPAELAYQDHIALLEEDIPQYPNTVTRWAHELVDAVKAWWKRVVF